MAKNCKYRYLYMWASRLYREGVGGVSPPNGGRGRWKVGEGGNLGGHPQELKN